MRLRLAKWIPVLLGFPAAAAALEVRAFANYHFYSFTIFPFILGITLALPGRRNPLPRNEIEFHCLASALVALHSPLVPPSLILALALGQNEMGLSAMRYRFRELDFRKFTVIIV